MGSPETSLTHGATPSPRNRLQQAASGWWQAIARPSVLLRLALFLTLIVYLRTVAYDFVFDDHLQVALNPWISSWSGLKNIFTLHSWAFSDVEMPARFYRPLYLVWLWGIRMLTDGVPAWFHLAAILSHLGVTCLAFLLARRLLRDDRSAVIAALLFALHPTKIEAVAWIAGASEVVHAAFFFGMFLAYFRWREESRWRWLAASAGCFACALLAKETAVVGAMLIVFYDWIAGRPNSQQQISRRLITLVCPFAAVAVAYALIRIHVLGRTADLNGHLSWIKTAYTVPLAFCWYLMHLIWPFRLSLLYPEMIVRRAELIRFAGAGALLLILATAYWRWSRRSTEMKFVGVWLVATLLPVVAAILLLQQHDRYLYLPSFAFAVIVAKLLSSLRPRYALSAGLALGLLFAVTTFVEEQYWETDRQIFTRATEIAPDLPKSWELLAWAYTDSGDDDKALEILRTAYTRSPQNERLAHALAEAYDARNDRTDAEAFYRRTLDLCGDDRFTRANSLYELGILMEREHRFSEAESLFRQAIAVMPNAKEFHYSLANALRAQGKINEAAEESARERQIRSSKWN